MYCVPGVLPAVLSIGKVIVFGVHPDRFPGFPIDPDGVFPTKT